MLTMGQMLYCMRSAYVSHTEWSDLWNQKGEQSVATRAGGGGVRHTGGRVLILQEEKFWKCVAHHHVYIKHF